MPLRSKEIKKYMQYNKIGSSSGTGRCTPSIGSAVRPQERKVEIKEKNWQHKRYNM